MRCLKNKQESHFVAKKHKKIKRSPKRDAIHNYYRIIGHEIPNVHNVTSGLFNILK